MDVGEGEIGSWFNHGDGGLLCLRDTVLDKKTWTVSEILAGRRIVMFIN